MAGFKAPDLHERAAAAKAAKEKALEQHRNRPAPDPAVLAERAAAGEAREAAKAERRALKKRAADEADELEAERKEAEKAQEKAASAPAGKPKRSEAELKAARDARYAARRARKR